MKKKIWARSADCANNIWKCRRHSKNDKTEVFYQDLQKKLFLKKSAAVFIYCFFLFAIYFYNSLFGFGFLPYALALWKSKSGKIGNKPLFRFTLERFFDNLNELMKRQSENLPVFASTKDGKYWFFGLISTRRFLLGSIKSFVRIN